MKLLRNKITHIAVLSFLAMVLSVTAQYNLKDHKICYVVGYAHLDTQWQWTMKETIEQYIPNTLDGNFALFQRYDDYVFTFEGSYRYHLAKQEYPSKYSTLKTYVNSGNWAVGGSWVDGCDVIAPSPESLIRHSLYGNGFFKKEFGKTSLDILLPDCFGFPYSLPTIAVHCGLIGFSTQKFDLWGGWADTPFPIGLWQGVDGSKIIACLKPGAYADQQYHVRTSDGDWLKANSRNSGSPGVWATYDYIGVGDKGGANSVNSVASLMNRIGQNGSQSIKVVSAASDQIYRDFLKYPQLIDGLPVYNNELVMKTHGTGCYTSWARMKLLNRQCEQMGESAEHAALMALWLGDMAYPTDKLSFAWVRFLDHQMHDDMTGTSIPTAYSRYSLPAMDSSLNELTEVRNAANEKIGTLLDTRVAQSNRKPIAVYNPLAIARKDIVETTVNWGGTPPTNIQVFDAQGTEVPSQVLKTAGNLTLIAFKADMPSLGYKVYQVSPTQSSLATELKITTSSLENEYYRVTVDANGDISEVYDKKTSKQLLSNPSRFEMRRDRGTTFPAWEIQYSDLTSSVREYVSGNVRKTIEENGPARVSLKVTRSQDGSSFTHYIRLGTKEAGSHIEIENIVDWRSDGTLLKVGFPLTCSNSKATFDLGIGVIERPNRTTTRYEVPGQQWADLSHSDNSYGVSVLNNCKYGWDKSSNSRIALTLIHSPSGGGYNYQQDLSNVINWIHEFTYGIYGHSGAWKTSNVVHEAERMNQPLVAFQPASAHDGRFTEFSFLNLAQPEKVSVMAVKKAELNNKYILRVRELRGENLSGAKVSFPSNVASAVNVTGQEDEITAQSLLPRVKPGPVQRAGKDITFDLKPFQIRAFAVEIDATNAEGNPAFKNLKGTIPFTVQVLQKKLNFRLEPDESVKSVFITNMAGQIIKVLRGRTANVNSLDYNWDGRNVTGEQLSSGIYIVNVQTTKHTLSQSVPIVR